MEYYVGLDVSLKQTSICVVDQTGSVVREGVVDSDPEAISVYVRSKAPDAVRIGLETGPTSTWLWTELKRFGLPVICIDARHAKAVLKMQINKSDRNDAIGIARIMQTGWFKEVHVKDIDSHSVCQPGAAGQDQARSREPCSRPSQKPRSSDRPCQVQCLRRTSR
jgi:transposase